MQGLKEKHQELKSALCQIGLMRSIIVNDVDHPINERAQTVAEHENLEILKWSNKSKIIETVTS